MKKTTSLKCVVLLAGLTLTHAATAGGWNVSVSNGFSNTGNLTGWEFTLPWNSTYKTTDYVLKEGYLELQMLQTDKGGNVLSPRFSIDGNIKVTVRHYMHQAAGDPYLGNIELHDETVSPANYNGAANGIHIGFQNSDYSPDYACSAYDIPRVADTLGCVPKNFQSTKTSSSLYDRWITTVIKYNKNTGKLTVDYDYDGIIDFDGTLVSAARFKVTRISFGGYGWFTGHFHRIDSVRVEPIK